MRPPTRIVAGALGVLAAGVLVTVSLTAGWDRPTGGGASYDDLFGKWDGVPTPELATQLFASTIARLPDTEPLADVPPYAGTLAVILTEATWEKIPPAQRDAIRQVLTVPADEAVATADAPETRSAAALQHAGLAARNQPASAAAQGADCFARLRPPGTVGRAIGAARGFLRPRLGGLERPVIWVPRFHQRLVERGIAPYNAEAIASTYPVRCVDGSWQPARGRSWDACLISSGPRWSVSRMDGALAHEVFHCYQYEQVGAFLSYLPGWVREGAPTWVGLSYAPEDATHLSHYRKFFDREKPLRQRDYDGVAVFAALADAGVNVWPKLIPLHAHIAAAAPFGEGSARSTRRAVDWLLEHTAESTFAATFASTAARRPDWGELWDIEGPGVPHHPGRTLRPVWFGGRFGAQELRHLNTGDPIIFTLEEIPVDARLLELTVRHPADQGVVVVGGQSRIFQAPTTLMFCLKLPCECESGTPPPGAIVVDDPLGPVVVAYTRWPSSRLSVPGRFPIARVRQDCKDGEQSKDSRASDGPCRDLAVPYLRSGSGTVAVGQFGLALTDRANDPQRVTRYEGPDNCIVFEIGKDSGEVSGEVLLPTFHVRLGSAGAVCANDRPVPLDLSGGITGTYDADTGEIVVSLPRSSGPVCDALGRETTIDQLRGRLHTEDGTVRGPAVGVFWSGASRDSALLIVGPFTAEVIPADR